jgi:ribonuclease Z
LKLTLLGTGSPAPNPSRAGPSQIIQCGDDLILVDCGAGTLHRLVSAGYERLNLNCIAFTHLHSDHVTGILDVLWAGWIQRRWQTAPTIYGPPGTAHFVDHLLEAMSYDIRVRTGPVLDPARLRPPVEEVEEDWQVGGRDWQLSSFRVEHLPVDQAFGYRIDQDSNAIVISGDTKACDNLARHAQGANLLVHEVFWGRGLQEIASAASDPEERARFELLKTYHTSSEDVGKVAADADAGHLVLSHILRSRGDARVFGEDIGPSYGGKLSVGEDLMSFEVGR